MRLSNSTTSDAVLRQLQRLTERQAGLQRQVATGQRIHQPGDDPAAAGRVIAARMERGALAQAARNASSALEYSKTTYSALDQLKRLSDRASELSVLGSGGLGPDAARAYAAEVDQLLEQALSLGNTTQRGDHVFAGAAVDTAPFVPSRDAAGRVLSVAYAGDSARPSVPLADGTSVSPGADGATNPGIADFMNGLVALRDALAANDQPALDAARPALANAEDYFVDSLSEHGAIQLRIEVAQARHTDRLSELDRQISLEASADLPEVIVRLNQASQAYEAALASSSTILKLSLLDYLR